jgi:hypothetical protein
VEPVLAVLLAALALVLEGLEGAVAVPCRVRHRHALHQLVRVHVLGVVTVERRAQLQIKLYRVAESAVECGDGRVPKGSALFQWDIPLRKVCF